MDEDHPYRILQIALKSLRHNQFINVVYENEIEPSPEGELTQTIDETFFHTMYTLNQSRPGLINFMQTVNGVYRGQDTDHIDRILAGMDDIIEITKYDSIDDLNIGKYTRLYNKSNFRPPKLLKTMRGQTPRSTRFGKTIESEIKYLTH
jgi:hypothetical protein